jgi:acyl transferase domain-containing protein
LILKPLYKALKDGDPIRAVIRETLLNQDGKTPTITSPNGDAQAELIRRCYANAGLKLSETSYVECHGTGTQAGDPTETGALAAAFGTKSSKPLYIGSVKSNIGHLEAVSGIAGIIKTVMAFEKGSIPPNHDLQDINSKILMSDWNLKVSFQAQINSFLIVFRYRQESSHGQTATLNVHQSIVLAMVEQMAM